MNQTTFLYVFLPGLMHILCKVQCKICSLCAMCVLIALTCNHPKQGLINSVI